MDNINDKLYIVMRHITRRKILKKSLMNGTPLSRNFMGMENQGLLP